jgi:transcriptional regulator with XRE-family HTH domain
MSIDQAAASSRSPVRESTLRLGQRLRSARLTRNLTQSELAKNQFSVSYISAVERGQIRPSLSSLEKLALRLQVPVTDLLGEGDSERGITRPTGDRRDATSERHREEVERSLREAQILAQQHKSTEAIGLLLPLQNQHLTPQETAQLQWQLASCYNDEGRAEEARRLAQQGISQAKQAGERELAERIRLELGRAFSLMRSPTAALEQYHECLRAIQEHVVEDPVFRLGILLRIATEYSSLADDEQAITFLAQAGGSVEEVNQPHVLGSVYWTISQTLAANDDRAGARRYALRSLAAYEAAEHRQLVAAMYNRLGMTFARVSQVGEALSQLNRAYEIAASQQDLRGIAEAKRNLALVYLEEKHQTEAKQASDEALASARQLGDAREQASSHLVLAQVQEAHHQTREATQSYETAIELLQAEQPRTSLDELRRAYAQFSEYLERHGESKRAFEMLKQAYKSAQNT